MNNITRFAAAVGILYFCSCAKAALSVKVDIYRKEVKDQVATRNIEEVDAWIDEVSKSPARRLELAKAFQRLYENHLAVVKLGELEHSSPITDAEVENTKKAVREGNEKANLETITNYISTLTAESSAIQTLADACRKANGEYYQLLQNSSPGERPGDFYNAHQLVRTTFEALSARHKKTSTEIPEKVSEIISNFIKDGRKQNVTARKKLKTDKVNHRTDPGFVNLWSDYVRECENLIKEIDIFAKTGDPVAVAAKSYIKAMLPEDVDNATAAPNVVEPANGGAKIVNIALGNIVSKAAELTPAGIALVESQIDRLQNPADPAWRDVSDQNNEHYWNNEFTRTFFEAEGRTEVVIVRDRTGHFRIQHAKNDPTALIEGQLRISRVVAGGLLDIVAAAAGVTGVPGVSQAVKNVAEKAKTGEAGDTTDTADPPADPAPATTTTTKPNAAAAKLRIAQITALKKSLIAELTTVQSDISKLDKDTKEVPADQLAKIQALLEQYKPLLAPAKAADAK